MGSALWSSERPEFVERVAKLAGGTTFRTPGGGHGTKQDQMPDTHAIAAALSFGRSGPEDVGPDVAYCWVLQSDAYRQKVVRMLAAALRCHEFRAVTTYRLVAAEAAWEAMVWNRSSARPSDAPRTYDRMLLTACGTLERAAWDALASAERAYRRPAAKDLTAG
jgi:hypothetical protein